MIDKSKQIEITLGIDGLYRLVVNSKDLSGVKTQRTLCIIAETYKEYLLWLDNNKEYIKKYNVKTLSNKEDM